jgi:preprotein translocase subunit YajC
MVISAKQLFLSALPTIIGILLILYYLYILIHRETRKNDKIQKKKNLF